jgi:guanylate kinase
MSKPLIICIIGESGVGKTHLSNYLEDTYGIELIESRTTRPPREPNERGHLFVSEEEFDTYLQEDMIAFTKFGEYRYCCLVKDVPEDASCYVIDEYGFTYLKKHFGDKFLIFAVRMFAAEHLLNVRVDPERRARDKDKFILSANHFDYFIDNDFTDSMYQKYDALYKYIMNDIRRKA